jgi:RNA polymerase sigma-70 factor (ECF subfamily)
MQSEEYRLDAADDESLYNELFTPLYRFLFFRTRDAEIANDLTQSAFLKFLLQKEKPQGQEHAHRLLFTIARTTLIDHWRVEGKRAHVSIDEVPELSGNMRDPQEEAMFAEEKRFIGAALAQLAADEAEIVALRLAGDVSYDAVAAVVGVSVANARQIYSRALKKLKQTLDERDFIN